MKSVLSAALFAAITAQAAITTKIAKIYPPDQYNENYEVLVHQDGQVLHLDPDTAPEVLETLEKALEYGQEISLELEPLPLFADQDLPEKIKKAVLLPGLKSDHGLTAETSDQEDFIPTQVVSMDKASEIFEGLYERTRWWTECYNRAHIWNRQIHKDHGVNNEKVFIFYTRKYRRSYPRWKWWFHTAPMVRVEDKEVVLDREYTNSPVSLESWEWQFSAPNREQDGHRCARIENMSEYYDRYNTNNIQCNILVAPMYYWEPSEVGDRERGVYKNEWINWELRHAAQDVFGRWLDVYEEYKL